MIIEIPVDPAFPEALDNFTGKPTGYYRERDFLMADWFFRYGSEFYQKVMDNYLEGEEE